MRAKNNKEFLGYLPQGFRNKNVLQGGSTHTKLARLSNVLERQNPNLGAFFAKSCYDMLTWNRFANIVFSHVSKISNWLSDKLSLFANKCERNMCYQTLFPIRFIVCVCVYMCV